MKSLTLIPGQLSLSQLRDVYSHPLNITLDSSAFAAIDESVACVNAILAEGRTAYGINTGFGLLAVEWLAAAQGLDMREGLTTSPLLEEARHLLRERVPHYTQDRYFAPDIDNAIALLAARHLTRLLPAVLH